MDVSFVLSEAEIGMGMVLEWKKQRGDRGKSPGSIDSVWIVKLRLNECNFFLKPDHSMHEQLAFCHVALIVPSGNVLGIQMNIFD